MALRWILCLLWCHLVVVTASNSLGKDDKKPSKKPSPKLKPGHFENCGEPGTDLALDINPGVVRFGDTMSIDFHVTSPVDMKEGYLNASIFINDKVDPLYQTPPGSGHFTCDDIHKYLPFLCPFHKTKRTGIEGYKMYLSPSIGVPAGDFRILLKLQDIKTKTILCMYGRIVVLDD